MSPRWEGVDLVHPISSDSPCGENLEGTQLLASFDAFPFLVFGLPKPPDTPPDEDEKRRPPEWSGVRKNALDALSRSKDLRLLAHLGAALLRTDGLEAFLHTLTVAADWLETYWNEAYPLIDEDAITRRSALNCFADPMAVVDRLRRLPLVSSRQHGTFSLRDIEMASGQAAGGASEPTPDQRQIDAAFETMPFEELVLVQKSVAGGREALQRIDGRMREYGGPDAAPDFDPLAVQLLRMDRVLTAKIAARPEAIAAEASETAEEGIAAGAGAPGKAIGSIASREDAIRALDAVAAYFRRTEPSSPVPFFVERTKRLVSKDFFAVLKDIAPDVVAQVRVAGGLRESE
ncbi:MAG: type VI secretion system protein TssA [Vicinamibacterales bacterium]